MIIRKPAYYDSFRCLAARCPDSCCKDWAVQVDGNSATYYRSLPGSLGDQLRQVLSEEDGQNYMTIENGRCPMWRSDGLCRIQAELGHDALCRTCREFPRLTHDYGSFMELGLELSCPEAARLILSDSGGNYVISTFPGEPPQEYDKEDMSILLDTRAQALALLSDTARPVNETLALLLFYGCHAQCLLDGTDPPDFNEDAALETARTLAEPGHMDQILTFFRTLEILTSPWRSRLDAGSQRSGWSDAHLALARYFVQRYWLQAISDFDLLGRVKLTILLCLLIRELGGDLLSTAQLCSKELENNADNIDALLDAAYSHPAFTDARLLGLLLSSHTAP